MISISVGEAKNKLPFFLHLVEENNESIEITRHGKNVAYINSQKANNSMTKKNRFLEGIKKFNSEDFSNSEIDQIFARQKDSESEQSVRHPEDFI